MKVELPDPAKGNVIVLEVVRKSVLARKHDKTCLHINVLIDTVLATLQCQTCKAHLNPMEWIAHMADEWQRVTMLYQGYVKAKASYEAKQRTRCEHCHKLTKVRPATAAQVREFTRC